MPPMQTDWDKLPDHVRHSPHVVDLRLTTLEKQGVHILETHARTHINLGSMLSHPVKTPVGNLPLGIAAAGAAYLYWRQPELLSQIIRVAWPF